MAANLGSAWKAYHRGDIDQANKTFETLASQPNASSQTHIQRGLFFLNTGRYQEAQESFGVSRNVDAKNPAPVFFLALSQELSEQYAASKVTINELRQLCPHHQGILTLELLEQIKNGDPLELLTRFGYGPNAGQKSQGSPIERLAAGLGKGDPQALPAELSSSDFLLGPILVEIEKKLHPLEVPTLTRDGDLVPEDINSIKPRKRSLSEELSGVFDSVRGWLPLRKGKNLFEKAYVTEDRQKQTRLLKQAARLLRLARKRDPYGFRVSYHLGETYLFLARGEPGKPYNRFRLLQAQTSFLQSIEHEGVNPYVLFYLAYVQHLLGRPLQAIDLYHQATKKFEKLLEAHYGEGQCHLLLGDETKAKQLFLRAVNSDLVLARERLEVYATLLSRHGTDYFKAPIPVLPPETAPEPSDPLPETVEQPTSQVPELSPDPPVIQPADGPESAEPVV